MITTLHYRTSFVKQLQQHTSEKFEGIEIS